MNIIECKKKLNKTFKECELIAEKLGFKQSAENIGEIITEFNEKEMMIVTVGEMKRGKSSLLNALLEETVFPVDINVCTNSVTILRYGESEKIEVHLEERKGNAVNIIKKEITRSEIADYVSEKENAGNHKNVSALVVEIPNPLLKDGIIFVDTPGVGALNVNHAETTYGFLPNADLLLFVSDCVNGLTETELNFLKKGHKYCKNILFPLTKKDLNPDYVEIVEDNKIKIADVLQTDRELVSIIPVSSMAKQRYLNSSNEMMLKNSNFPRFEELMWSTIAEHKMEIFILRFIQLVKEELYKIGDSIVAQQQVLTSDKSRLSELQANLESEIQKINQFKEDESDWKSDINNFFEKMRNKNVEDVNQIRIDIKNYFDECVTNLGAKICEEENYSEVYNTINGYISDSLLSIKETMIFETEEQIAEISCKLNLNANSYSNILDNMNFVPNESVAINFPVRSTSDKLMNNGRTIGMGMMGGSKIGMIAGGIVGAGLALFCAPAAIVGGIIAGGVYGSAIGMFGGGVKGFSDSIKNGKAIDIPYVQKAFQSHIEESITHINKLISDGFADLKKEVTRDTEKQINKKVTELRESVDQIKALIVSSKSDGEKAQGLANASSAVNAQLSALENYEKQELKEDVSSSNSNSGGNDVEYSFL